MMKQSIYLPRFTVGKDAFNGFYDEMGRLGKKVALFYGKKAWEASKKRVLSALNKADMSVAIQGIYGGEATVDNVQRIVEKVKMTDADMILAVGGGKCIDTVKAAADELELPVFTIPSIASNCAPVTKISILYHEDGSFHKIVNLKSVPVHCFINPEIILEAPEKYLWAGIGDAMAKHVESEWSASLGEYLDFGSELGIISGRLCFDPLVRDGEKAMKDAKCGILSKELENTIVNIIIAPGITSVSVHPDYNGGVAHALFYGLTKRAVIEKEHLHGEVVSYGTLVNLMLDGNEKKLKQAYQLNSSIGLPVCLANLDLDSSDTLDDVLEETIKNQELLHVPYQVTKENLYQAILRLEKYSINYNEDTSSK